MRTFYTALLALFLGELSFAQPLIVLDAGHNPQQGGALGVRGIYEVDYNDRFVAELQPQLEKIGWQVLLTRKKDQTVTLGERVQTANQQNADLFLSIHHDSAQEHYLQETQFNSKKAYQTITPIGGSSLFISHLNGQPEQSYCLANAIGRNIADLGRAPALHHAEPIAGENRPLLNATYGIYRYDNLAVLRGTQMPAVLLEVGVIPDKADEAYINHPTHRKAIEKAVVQAVQTYSTECLTRTVTQTK
ncbi:MAG: N-acetylmuramoyl-L-alanine amidase [Neisseriaceae bacterium]|nr:N-acetylmuramoyl-L-alanine amidase [Neisseriaceae bacterium]